jgi:hypothetical protein
MADNHVSPVNANSLGAAGEDNVLVGRVLARAGLKPRSERFDEIIQAIRRRDKRDEVLRGAVDHLVVQPDSGGNRLVVSSTHQNAAAVDRRKAQTGRLAFDCVLKLLLNGKHGQILSK